MISIVHLGPPHIPLKLVVFHPRRHFWESGRPGLWSPDFLLKITMESLDSRVQADQGPKNASLDCDIIPPYVSVCEAALYKSCWWFSNLPT